MSNHATIQVRPVQSGRRWVWRITQQADGQKAQSGDSPKKSDATKKLRELIEGYLAAGFSVDATVTDQTENGFHGNYTPDGKMSEKEIHSRDVLGPRCSTLPRTAQAQAERRQALRASKDAKKAKPPKGERKAKTEAKRTTRPPKAAQEAKPPKTQGKKTTKPPTAAVRTTKPPEAAPRRRGRPPKAGPKVQRETMLSKFLGLTPSAQSRYVAGLPAMTRGLLKAQAAKHGTPSQARAIAALVDSLAPPKAAAPTRQSSATKRATELPAGPVPTGSRSRSGSTSRSRPPAMPLRSTSRDRQLPPPLPARTSGSPPVGARSRSPVSTPSLSTASSSGEAAREARMLELAKKALGGMFNEMDD